MTARSPGDVTLESYETAPPLYCERSRHVTYRRAPKLRNRLQKTGCKVLSLAHVDGRLEPRLHTLAQAAA